RRLSKGDALNQPLVGRDEICRVDQVFHDMAKALSQSDKIRSELIQQLQASEARTRSVVDSMLDGLIIISDCGSIESLNPSAQRLFGYRTDELLGKNVAQLFTDKDPEIIDAFLDNLKRRSLFKVSEWKARLKDGHILPVELSLYELKAAEGQSLAVNV